jgi:hypothetical protein
VIVSLARHQLLEYAKHTLRSEQVHHALAQCGGMMANGASCASKEGLWVYLPGLLHLHFDKTQ